MSYGRHITKPLNARLREIWEGARLGRRLAQVATGFGALSPLMALANPTGGHVVGGQATISNLGPNGTLINQSSQNAAINWQQFNVAGNQYVQFVQPNSSSVVLNRVIGGAPSSIFGNIIANGQVFLINPNGILFGRGATLDVGGLVASTQTISDSDFMAGHYAFAKGAGAPDASVINRGTLTATNGYLVLAGDYVENDGVINAQSGHVLLAAGGGTTLTLDKNQGLISYSIDSATLAKLAGVTNTGSIAADGGTVIMTADVANALTATAVNNSGFVAAHSIKNQNGIIILTAQGGDIDNSGTLDASATDSGVAGGTVILRGDEHTTLTSTGVVDAEGNSAKGGFIELSGHTLHVGGQVTVGNGGSLLIDPPKLFITSGNTAAGVITSGGYVGEHFIDTQLNAGVNVSLVASGSILAGVPVGVPSVVAATAINATGTGNLTIKTGTLTAGAGGTLANIGTNGNCQGAGVCQPGTALKFAATSGTVSLSGVSINIKGALTANALQGTVNLGAVQANAIAITGGTVNIGGNLTASAGNLSIAATHGPTTPATITVATGMVLSGKAVNINASGSYGGMITLQDVHATSGSINITAKRTTGLGIGSAVIAAGNLTAAKGKINLLETGLKGKITVGNLSAVSNGISLLASDTSTTVAGGSIAVVSAIAKTIQAVTHVSKGGNITVTGALSAGGSIASGSNKGMGIVLNANATGLQHSGAKVVVGGAINATAGGARIDTMFSGASAGIGASVSVHNVSAKTIDIETKANNRPLNKGGITVNGNLLATGTATNAGVILISQKGGGSGSGNIKVTGSVTASHATVLIADEAKHGAPPVSGIQVGAITASKINLSISAGTDSGMGVIQTGNLKTTAGVGHDITVNMNNTRKDSITIGGSISAGGNLAINEHGHYKQSNLTVSGPIKAGGNVNIHQGGGSGTLAMVTNLGNITAGGAASLGFSHFGAGAVNATVGNVAAAGLVTINESVATGGITVGNVSGKAINIRTTATTKGANINAGSLNATGSFGGTGTGAHMGVNLNANLTGPNSNSGGNVTVTGAITAVGQVIVKASHIVGSAAPKNPNTISLQNVTGAAVNIQVVDHAPTSGRPAGGTINVANITATGKSHNSATHVFDDVLLQAGHINFGSITGNGSVILTANDVFAADAITEATGKNIKGKSVAVSTGDFSFSGNVVLGNISAASHVQIFAGSGAHPHNITTGNITSPKISINANALGATIAVGNLTAVSTAGSASVGMFAGAGLANGGITVNGNITVNGKTPTAVSGLGAYQLPNAAGLFLQASAGAGFVSKVKITGAVNVTALPGTYAGVHSASGEGTGIKGSQHGKGGLANFGVFAGGSHGSVSIAGAATVKGPDAHMDVQAAAIKLNNVTITGSGHSVTRHVVSTTSVAGSFNSTNDVGQATLNLGIVPTVSSPSAKPTASIKAGNIVISGKGLAQAFLHGSNVAVGSAQLTATAATGTRSKSGTLALKVCTLPSCAARNSNGFFRGLDSRSVGTGTFKGGHAEFVVSQIGPGSGGSLARVKSISAGAVTVNGVGRADIGLFGSTVQTKSLSATAAPGSGNGHGSSHVSNSVSVGKAVHSSNIKGGEAGVKIRAATATVTGSIAAHGPIAGVNVMSGALTVTGGITVTGSGGGSVTTDTVFTPSAGTKGKGVAYHTHFTGPGRVTGVTLQTTGTLSVGGNIKITGTGLVGALAVGANVTLGGLSASDNGAAHYSALDTRVSATATSFTAGSITLLATDLGVSGGVTTFAPATVSGNVTLTAKSGNINIPDELNVGGAFSANAAVNVEGSAAGTIPHIHAVDNLLGGHQGGHSGGSVTSAGVPKLHLSAASVLLTAGGNIGLGAAKVTAGKLVTLTAGTNVVLGGAGISAGSLLVHAGGSITDGGAAGTIKAGAVAATAVGAISLSNTSLNIGNGLAPGVTGDSGLLAALAAEGLSPSVPRPDGYFKAGPSLSLGAITMTGDYLYLQADAISIAGPVSLPLKSVVQVSPSSATLPIDIEDTTIVADMATRAVVTFAIGTTAGTTPVFGLTNQGFFSQLPGDTIVVGNLTEQGNVTLASLGKFTLANGTNLVIDTLGNVTGLADVTSTGKVIWLESVVGGTQGVTPGQVGFNTGTTTSTTTGLGDTTDKKKLGSSGGGGTGGGQQNGTVSNGGNTGSGVCH